MFPAGCSLKPYNYLEGFLSTSNTSETYIRRPMSTKRAEVVGGKMQQLIPPLRGRFQIKEEQTMVRFQKVTSLLLTFVVGLLLVGPQNAAAHVVPMTKLNDDVTSATQARQAKIGTVQKLLATEQAQQMLRAANVDTAKAQKSVTLLSDNELNQLAERASQVEADLAAGLTRGQTSLLILVGAVVVIILVIAAVA
jgi:hypothetical protein